MPTRASKPPKPPKPRKREDAVQAARRVVDTVIAQTEGPQVVRGVTDEDPNTGRRVSKPKKSAIHKVIDPAVSAAASALSKLGASKGGEARARSLSAKRRTEIAKQAATARWKA